MLFLRQKIISCFCVRILWCFLFFGECLYFYGVFYFLGDVCIFKNNIYIIYWLLMQQPPCGSVA